MSIERLKIAREFARGLRVDPGIDGSWQLATVQAVHAGTHTVDVYLDNNSTGAGTSITLGVPYLHTYSPIVADVVLVARMTGSSRSARIVIGTFG